MNPDQGFVYTGVWGTRRGNAHPDSPPGAEPYVAAAELIEAVNLAIFLRRPLLLEGEAGCGKTRLARAVAHELGLPYYAWPVRSTSRAQDGLYTYDSILRLHDVHTQRVEQKRTFFVKEWMFGPTKSWPTDAAKPAWRDPRNPKDYRKFGALGKAFSLTGCPAVVLIDEIDKADIDFPNDLLTVLDEPWKFDIPETGETIAASPGCTPIVFITSNKEKGNLPTPFLRRCIYFYLEFPEDPDRLKKIIDSHYKNMAMSPPADELIEAAAKRFLKMRAAGDLFKKPGTSELLDWLEVLRGFGNPARRAEVLAQEKAEVPFPEILFKLREDLRRYRKTS
jgi:MoxR-like ATPase